MDEDKERAQSRNPITDDELPYAKWLGSSIRSLRLDAGFTAGEFVAHAQINCSTLFRIENALRHTRASTLERFAGILAWRLGEDRDELAALLIRVAGPALAPEAKPEHQGRIDRRREKRTRRQANLADQRAYVRMRLRELPRDYSGTHLVRGPDGKFLPWEPTPEQLVAIEQRLHRAGLVMPPLNEEGRFDRDSPLLMRHINAMHFGATACEPKKA